VTDTLMIDPVALTHHIEQHFHARHREQFPQLIAWAEKVEAVHADQSQAPHDLAAALRRFFGELDDHMRKEEFILFPAMRRGGMPGIEHPIHVMRADHAGHIEEAHTIRRLAGDLILPEGACRTWTMLYEDLGQFLSDFGDHVRTENETLFPLFEH